MSRRVLRVFILTVRIMTLTSCLGMAPFTAQAQTALATGPASQLHMLLQKTIFGIDVLKLRIRVDLRTQSSLQALATLSPRPKDIDDRIAQALYDARHLKVTMRFLRDVSYSRLRSKIRSNVACARKSGVITDAEKNRVDQGLSHWFAPIRSRGIHRGDVLTYLIAPGSFHTALRSSAGKLFINQTDHAGEAKLSLLGGYLAPCSEFRKPLIQSLLGSPQRSVVVRPRTAG